MALFGSGEEPSERAKALAENATGDSVTAEVLGKTKASGLGSHDYLADGPLVEHLNETEQPQFVFAGAGPGAKVERDNSEDITSVGKYRVVLALTDERILVVVGDGDAGDWNFELSYESVVAVEILDGELRTQSKFQIRTADETYGFSYMNVSVGEGELEKAREFIRNEAGGLEEQSSKGTDDSCPDCGRKVLKVQDYCRNCGATLDGETAGKASEGTLNYHLDCEPQGDWVNKERLEKVSDLLDADESVHYMWRGGTIDVEGSSAGESIFGNDRDRKSSFKGIFTAVTDKRIVISIPQFLGDDERHIPYRSVTSVDLDTGLMARRVSLQTKGQTYHIQAQGPSKDELRDAMRFIREKVEEVHQPQQVQATNEPDPTEQLQNLKELHDQGVLSDEEFEEKKQSLLDKI